MSIGSKVSFISDKLKNLVANIGTPRDKHASSYYAASPVDDYELLNAYRYSWICRKAVEIPALDSCRRWRGWQGTNEQISAIEAEEKRLGIKHKVLEARTKARHLGGAAIYIGDGTKGPGAASLPLDPTKMTKGGIKYLTVLTRKELKAGEMELDVTLPNYGKPKFYNLSGRDGTTIQIHPSRLIIFIGNPLPDERDVSMAEYGWGDSILNSIIGAAKDADATNSNVASLVFEAKVDVVKVPNLMNSVGDKVYRDALMERLQLAATAKGINGMLMLDFEEDYSQKSASFATLPDIMDRFLQNVSAACDIPATRFLSQSPAGMSATGESDLRNYYDRVSSAQELEMEPALRIFDECLLYSALGSRPKEIFYNWLSLWQLTAKEQAEIGSTIATTGKTLADSKMVPEEALSHSLVTALIESGVFPGLEENIAKYGSELPKDEEPEDGATIPGQPPKQTESE